MPSLWQWSRHRKGHPRVVLASLEWRHSQHWMDDAPEEGSFGPLGQTVLLLCQMSVMSPKLTPGSTRPASVVSSCTTGHGRRGSRREMCQMDLPWCTIDCSTSWSGRMWIKLNPQHKLRKVSELWGRWRWCRSLLNTGRISPEGLPSKGSGSSTWRSQTPCGRRTCSIKAWLHQEGEA